MKYTHKSPTRHEFVLLFGVSGGVGGGFGDVRMFSPALGGGYEDIMIFTSDNVARRRIAKMPLPCLMKTVAPEDVTLGRNIVSNVIEGKNIRSSVKLRELDTIRKFGERFVRGGRVKRSK